VWKRTARGLALTFHLAGINNQNFLMRDDQTGSFWQQITGRAISGAMTGYQLEPVFSDELSFALWRHETPGGTVLKPVARYSAQYAPQDWDVRMAKAPTVLQFPNTGLQPRDLVLGIDAAGTGRAYPVLRILSEKLIEDRVGAQPVIVVLGPDEKSIRVFQARLRPNEPAPEYYRQVNGSFARDSQRALFIDSVSGSGWSFAGCAISGPLAGTCLKPVPSIKDYWFDWRNYHPATTIFRR
jgi:hypothetical protein